MRLILLLLLSSCSLFFSSEGPKTAKGKYYTIKFDSPDWSQLKKENRSDYVFENKNDGRIQLSNSFCNEFQDQTLERLALKTFRAIGNFKSKKGDYTTFNNREAYRLEGMGKVDGVEVELHLLNTRRDNCYFDFVAITPIEKVSDRVADFDTFLNSVVFK
jgi:hypothetical protein